MNDAEIERVAKAIYGEGRIASWEDTCAEWPAEAHRLREEAKAALSEAEAIFQERLKERNLKILSREPTEAMLDAADRNAEPDGIWFDMWSAAPQGDAQGER